MIRIRTEFATSFEPLATSKEAISSNCSKLAANSFWLVIPTQCGKLRESFVAFPPSMCDTNIVSSEERKQITIGNKTAIGTELRQSAESKTT